MLYQLSYTHHYTVFSIRKVGSKRKELLEIFFWFNELVCQICIKGGHIFVVFAVLERRHEGGGWYMAGADPEAIEFIEWDEFIVRTV